MNTGLYPVCRFQSRQVDSPDGRHVVLPRPLLKMVPRSYFSDTTPGVLRLLTEEEWRSIGVTQSVGWVHYEVHGMCDCNLYIVES
jgi:hypothetical protein